MSTPVKTLQTKDVHIALKRDDAVLYLMTRFNFSRKEDLFEAIRKVTPSGADDLIRRLEKKEKSFQRRERNNSSADVSIPQEIHQEEQPVQASENDIIVGEVETAVNTSEQKEENMQKLPDIEQLKAQEQELSAMRCSLEGEHKELVAKRRAIVASLDNAQKAIQELRRLLGEQKKNAIQLHREYEECATQMEAINQERRTCEALLEEIRGKISDLNKITILVYQNGTIEVENGEIPSVSDEEVTVVLCKLVSMPQVGKITVDELKAIAKLLKMVKVYEANGCPLELEFDSTEVQRLWETVTTA